MSDQHKVDNSIVTLNVDLHDNYTAIVLTLLTHLACCMVTIVQKFSSIIHQYLYG